MKKCKTCNEMKSYSCFVFNTKFYDHYSNHCTLCENKKRQANKEKSKINNKKFSDNHKSRKVLIVEERGNVCLDCGNSFPICCYDFHHRVQSEKEYQWGEMVYFSNERLKTELNKCDLLCANCHRIRHSST